MLDAVEQVRTLEQNLLNKAAEAKPRFDKRGQLLPRERLNLLLDPGAPFLELASLAGYKLHDDKDGSSAGGGLIAGIGYVSACGCWWWPTTARSRAAPFPPRLEKIPAPATDRHGKLNCR